MSLINDALKRANQNQPPPDATPPGAPMIAVTEAAAGPKKSSDRLVPVLVVAMLCASVFFFWKWRQASGASQRPDLVEQAVAPARVEVRSTDPASTIAETEEPAASVASPAPRNAVERAIATGPVVVAPTAAPRSEPVAVQAPPVMAPTPTTPIRLQAILFRLRNPTVIINGRTLELGQSTDGATVVDIQRNHVVVERGGRREKLELP
jgi:hypothetical protein